MPRSSRIAGIALICLMPVAGAAGQMVRGVIQRAGDQTPVGGAVVSVVDAAGATSARTISDEHGRYSVLWAPNATRLHVVRIGLRPVSVNLPSGAPRDTTIDLVMDLVPALLDTVRVALNPVCPDTPDRREAAKLWDQARDGLLTAIVARDAKPAVISNLIYERRMDRRDQRVTQQRSHVTTGSTTKSVTAARAGSEFVEKGFRSMQGTEEVYYAPDADVMFDDNFATTHCFGLQRANDAHRGQIGLTFEPTEPRMLDTLIDVRGVLWIDQAAGKLMQLEFRYTGVKSAAERAGAGGTLHFQSMPNGVVLIDEWTFSIPAIATMGKTSTLIDLTETGGIVLTAVWPDGTRWKGKTAAIRGRVADRAASEGIPHAILTIDGLVDSATTAQNGSYVFSPVIPGRYSVHVTDTTLSHFMKRRTDGREIVVAHGDTAVLDFDMRSMASSLGDICKGEHPAAGTGTILGRVADGSGEWPSKLTVQSSWTGAVSMGEATTDGVAVSTDHQVADVDDSGNFRLCGVVRDRPVHLRVAVGHVPVSDTVVTIASDVASRIVTWILPSDIFAVTQRGDGASVSGRVVREGDGTPIPDADVWTVVGDIHARTDSAGNFRIYGLHAGSQLLQVRRLGFAPKHDTVTMRAGEQATRQFQLATQVAELDTVHTTSGMVKYISPRLQAFEVRRAGGQGHYVSEAEMRKYDNGPLSSMLGTHVPGILLIGYKGSTYASSMRGHAAVLADPNDQLSPRGCWVAIYVDGIPMYTGAYEVKGDTAKIRGSGIAVISSFMAAPDLSRMPVSDFAGIEFYSDATLPLQFNAPRQTNCGSLLLWTRER